GSADAIGVRAAIASRTAAMAWRLLNDLQLIIFLPKKTKRNAVPTPNTWLAYAGAMQWVREQKMKWRVPCIGAATHEQQGPRGELLPAPGQCKEDLRETEVPIRKGVRHLCAQHPPGRSGKGA